MIQITIIQIDNYAPWTVTPIPRGEANLQILQASLYAELQRMFSDRKGIVFYTRFDNLIAVTNGIGVEEHKEIQEAISSRFPVTVSFGIACAENAMLAQELASRALQRLGSSRDPRRKEVIAVHSLAEDGYVQIAHLDINGITATYTDKKPIYENYVLVNKVLNGLIDALAEKNSLVFFIGGDNYMSVCNGMKKEDFDDVIEHIEELYGVELKVGIGIAKNADRASRLSSFALERIREGIADKIEVLSDIEEVLTKI